MPNLTPAGWDRHAAEARAAKRSPWCGTDTCVDITDNGDGTFTFFSTIEGNDDTVTYTAAEVAAFGNQVKLGQWDLILASAAKHALKDLTTV